MTHIPSPISKLLDQLGSDSTQLQFLYIDKQPDAVQLSQRAQSIMKTATEIDLLLNVPKIWRVTYHKETRTRKEEQFLTLLNERLLFSSQKHTRDTVINTIHAVIKQADKFEYKKPEHSMKPLELVVVPAARENVVLVYRKNTGGVLFCKIELQEAEA